MSSRGPGEWVQTVGRRPSGPQETVATGVVTRLTGPVVPVIRVGPCRLRLLPRLVGVCPRTRGYSPASPRPTGPLPTEVDVRVGGEIVFSHIYPVLVHGP